MRKSMFAVFLWHPIGMFVDSAVFVEQHSQNRQYESGCGWVPESRV